MASRSAVFLLLVTLTFATGLAAQDPQPYPNTQSKPVENPPEPDSHGTRLRWQDIPKNVLHDQLAIFTSPFHINRDNAKWWIAFGGATAALIATDQRFSNRLAQHNSLTTPSRWASRLGADYLLFPAWASFYVVGKASDSPRARDTARLGIEALIDADISVSILKAATQRPRPEIKGESVQFFRGGDAFPSGHSIKTWALARIVSREFSEKRIVRVVASGMPVVEIGDARRLEIVFEVLSTDAVRIRPGADVIVQNWGGDETLAARIRTIEPGAYTKVSALGVEEQRVNVIAEFCGDPPLLGDGYRVEGEVVVWESPETVQVPVSA